MMRLTAGAMFFLLAAAGSVDGPVTFRRVQLTPDFYSEGINTGDINRDGIPDIVAGPHWYPGPSFTQQIAFREPRATPWPVQGDTDCYAIFVHDLSGDGWPDVLSFRRPGGDEAVWYENPQGASGYWKEHVAFSAVHNESPAFADVDGDGMPELITNSSRYGGWVRPDRKNPRAAWSFHSVTEQAPATWGWQRFTHGVGVGDVNGDGRPDLLFPQGWWEQPANPTTSPWTHHPVDFWGHALPTEGRGGAHMYAYDVDGDGDNDVITSLQAHGWGLAWFENRNGTFIRHSLMNTRADTEQYGVAFPQLHALALGDIDGDGLQDIVTGKRRGAHGNGLGAAELNAPAVLYWFQLVREPGQLPRYVPYLIDDEAGIGTQVVIADVNGDNAPDVLTAARQGAYVFLRQR